MAARHKENKKEGDDSHSAGKATKAQRRRTGAPSKTRKKKIARKRKRSPATQVMIRRSIGRKEKFSADRMAQLTSRSGVPFLMARDIAKNVSKKVRTQAKAPGKGKKERTIDAAKVREMIVDELHEKNQKSIASSYAGNVPENTQRPDMSLTIDTNESLIGSGDKDSVLHDRSKRLGSTS